MNRKYVIKSLKTGKTFLRCKDGFHDWCMQGEGERQFMMPQDAALAAELYGISDYEIVEVECDTL